MWAPVESLRTVRICISLRSVKSHRKMSKYSLNTKIDKIHCLTG